MVVGLQIMVVVVYLVVVVVCVVVVIEDVVVVVCSGIDITSISDVAYLEGVKQTELTCIFPVDR